ncbi:14363_t:CDS:10, partial [Funneliformis geosporum]
DDPDYRDTPLVSQVIKPSVRTVTPPEQRRSSGGRGGSFNRNQYQQHSGYQSYHNSQNHQHQQHRNYNYSNYNSNRYGQQKQLSPRSPQAPLSYTKEERLREDHHRTPTQEQQSPPPSVPVLSSSSSSSIVLPSLSSFSQLSFVPSSSTTLPPIHQISDGEQSYPTRDQNIALPQIIQLPKQNVDFISCNIPYEEKRIIEGLNMAAGQVNEPDFNLFCDSKIVYNLLAKKNSMEDISHEKFTEARQKSNPYEKVGNSIFMNRAAVKLACLDSLVGLTGIKRYDPVKESVFLFADLCGGPGGFTEYLLSRKQSWGEKVFGWGITLKNSQDFDFNRFHHETMPESHFKPCYGIDDTGDLYKEENIRDFAKVVKKETQEGGVDLVTADGGFDVKGQERYQESLLKQLILCQVITMFMTLRKNGDFVLKVFDIFTPFTGGIVWILYRHFEKLCIIKPLSSRPANSEKYIICRNLRENNPAIIDYLFKVNRKFNEIKYTTMNKSTLSPTTTSSSSLNQLLTQDYQQIPTPKEDINEIIDFSEINKDQGFLEYIKRKNIEIAKDQIEAIKQLMKFVDNPEMKPLNQEEYRRLCLQEWSLPNEE